MKHNVSDFIRAQVPAIYQEDDVLVSLLEAYYEFVDSNNQMSHKAVSNIIPSQDIDDSLHQFLIHFTEKYLDSFSIVSASDTRFVVKHIMDYYRSKGSEKSLKLLMKLFFNEDVEVYYPYIDILKPSHSVWVNMKYFELNHNISNRDLVGKYIKKAGTESKAFVEGLVTKKIKNRLIDVIYTTKVEGNFNANDVVVYKDYIDSDLKILGSLSQIEIVDGAYSYNIGDQLSITGTNGVGGLAIVTSLNQLSNGADIKLVDGGYGYTLDAHTEILVSDHVIVLDNSNLQFPFGKRVIQRLEQIDLDNATANLSPGQIITSNNLINMGVVASSNTSAILINLLSGTFTAETQIFKTGNVTPIAILSTSNEDITGDIVDQTPTKIGVKWDIANTIPAFSTNYTTTITLLDNGVLSISKNIINVSVGSGAALQLNSLKNTETVSINTDIILPYGDVHLNAADYGFKVTTTNINSVINDAINFQSLVIGEIESLAQVNPGSDYSDDVMVRVVNNAIRTFEIYDMHVTVTGPFFRSFKIGEAVTTVNGARGIVKSVSGNTMVIKDMSLYTDFIPGQVLTGTETNATAVLVLVTRDLSSRMIGDNAIISGKVQQIEGTIGSVSVIDSGFGYKEGDQLTLSHPTKASAKGTSIIGGVGSQKGYWDTTSSHLNSEKKLEDNFYYQEYSFVTKAKLSLNTYINMIRELTQVAGTKMFGEVSIVSQSSIHITGSSSVSIN